jgi:hypothetical protein
MNRPKGDVPEVEVLQGLLDHPIAPAPISDVVAHGTAVLRRRRRRTIVGAAVGIMAATIGTTAVVQSMAADPRERGPSVADASRDATTSPMEGLTCRSGQMSSGNIDFAVPESIAEARRQGWPATADEAVRRTLEGSAFTELRSLSLTDGVPIDLADGVDAVRYDAMNEHGDVLASLTVEEILSTVWAVTKVEHCSSATQSSG